MNIKNFTSKILPILAIITSFNTHSSTDLQNEAVVGEFSSQYDLYVAKNSCNGATYKSQLNPVKLHIKSKSLAFFNSIDSFTVTAGGVTSYAVKENDDRYYYKDFFGKERHYEQFNIEGLNDGGKQFTLTTYPYHGKPDINGELIVDIMTTNGNHKLFKQSLDSKNLALPPKEYLLNFDAKIMNGEVITKLSNDTLVQGKDVKVTYHYSINDDSKKYEISSVYKGNDARSEIITKLTNLAPNNNIDSFSYLGVYYDYVDIPEYNIESKVELYDANKEFFKNMLVTNNSFCF